MRCIFCKSISDSSKSIEHIVPEALGNIDHVLPRGVVCDKCNNYFARKIEKPLLESEFFIQARFRNFIGNKKKRIPNLKTLHLKSKTIVEIDNNDNTVYPSQSGDSEKFIEAILGSDTGTLIFPVAASVDKYLMSRFLGKMAIEALAQRFLDAGTALDLILNERDLDILRNYVRFGSKKIVWLYYEREIYPESKVFHKEDGEHFEMLHEYQFFRTASEELHFVIAIFGMEYTLNMESQSTVSYEEWLKNNSNRSPLYMDDQEDLL